MKLFKKAEFGVIKVQDENGAPVASFTGDSAGQFAYGCFVAGLVRVSPDSVNAASTLFDEDMQQYVVGTVTELTDAVRI